MRVYLLDWDNGMPWGALVAESPAQALYLAQSEYVGMGLDPAHRPECIKVTTSQPVGEPPRYAYWPSVWRWIRPT